MPNLQGANSIGRDDGGHSYTAHMSGSSRLSKAKSWDGGILGAAAVQQ